MDATDPLSPFDSGRLISDLPEVLGAFDLGDVVTV